MCVSDAPHHICTTFPDIESSATNLIFFTSNILLNFGLTFFDHPVYFILILRKAYEKKIKLNDEFFCNLINLNKGHLKCPIFVRVNISFRTYILCKYSINFQCTFSVTNVIQEKCQKYSRLKMLQL